LKKTLDANARYNYFQQKKMNANAKWLQV